MKQPKLKWNGSLNDLINQLNSCVKDGSYPEKIYMSREDRRLYIQYLKDSGFGPIFKSEECNDYFNGVQLCSNQVHT